MLKRESYDSTKSLSLAIITTITPILLLATTACSPEVGSAEWCEQMREKAKADWTANETKDFAKHCIF